MIKLIRSFVLVLSIALIAFPSNSIAQDLRTVNIDNLTDDQVLKFVEQAQARGLSLVQLEALARQRGLSESKITKLRSRIEQLDTGTSPSSVGLGQRTSPIASEGDVFGMLSGAGSSRLTQRQRRIFGYDLFQREGLTFAPNLNLPTPMDYQLGPGDMINIDLWGTAQAFFNFKISAEGTIRPNNLSPIYVNGLTIERAEKRIIERLSQIYSGLKGNKDTPPTIFYQLSLGSIRTINVDIIGEVEKPGNYALSSLSTVYTALHAAGGPSEGGSFREVKLIRNNKLLETVDIYTYLTEGVRKGDIRLENGDAIVVRPLLGRVALDGKVRRPGLFELKPGENFDALLIYAGGFGSSAYKSLVTVKRNGEKEREILDLDVVDFSTFEPQDGDEIQVSNILDRFSNRVIINGAVFRKGEYQLTEGLTLSQLIEKAEGLRGDAFLDRITIYRTNDDFSQVTIPVDLNKLKAGTTEDIVLVKEDVVSISSIYDLREEYFVKVSGEVIDDGVYPFFNQMTVQDLLVLAGGLKESASGALIEISRRNQKGDLDNAAEIISFSIDEDLSLSQSEKEMILQPFDQVYIRKTPGYSIQEEVIVEGEVLVPGQYTLQKRDERISDILKRAKGLTEYAYPKGAIIIRRSEFSNREVNNRINQQYLARLRQKVMSDESELKNKSQERLMERLDKIGEKNSLGTENDIFGGGLKKEAIEGVTEADAQIPKTKIAEKEQVVIDLDQILKKPGSKYDLIVKSGDIISVPGKLETVRVAGEVRSQVNVRFDDTYSFKDYINQSGGTLRTARKGRSYIQYPNGENRGVRRFLWFKIYPKVEPGSTIFVSKKPEREGMSMGQWLAIASGLATITLTVDRLSGN